MDDAFVVSVRTDAAKLEKPTRQAPLGGSCLRTSEKQSHPGPAQMATHDNPAQAAHNMQYEL